MNPSYARPLLLLYTLFPQPVAEGLFRRCLGCYVEEERQGHRWRGPLRLAIHTLRHRRKGETRLPPSDGVYCVYLRIAPAADC